MLVESLAGVVGWGILVLCHIASHLQDGLPRRLGMAVSNGKSESRSSESLEATFRGCAVSLHDILKGKARTKVSPDSMGWEIN